MAYRDNTKPIDWGDASVARSREIILEGKLRIARREIETVINLYRDTLHREDLIEDRLMLALEMTE